MCDSQLSFHESKQTVPVVNTISSDFYMYEFKCEKKMFFFSEILVRHKCLVFCVCVRMYLPVGVKHRGQNILRIWTQWQWGK